MKGVNNSLVIGHILVVSNYVSTQLNSRESKTPPKTQSPRQNPAAMSSAWAADKPEAPSGIREDEHGNRVVGGSVRADGSVRKTFKVRPGFTPKEDVAKYVPVGRRRLQEDPSSGELKSQTSPKVRDINSILGAARQPARPKTLDKTTQQLPALPKTSTANADAESLANSFGKLAIAKTAPKDESTTESKIAAKAEPKGDPEQTDSKKKFDSETKPGLKKDTTIDDPVANAEKKTLDKTDNVESKEKKPAGQKYIPPWKR